MPKSLARQTAHHGSQLQGRPLRRQQLEALLALHTLTRELVVRREARRVRALRRRAVRRLLLRAAGAASSAAAAAAGLTDLTLACAQALCEPVRGCATQRVLLHGRHAALLRWSGGCHVRKHHILCKCYAWVL